MADDNVILYLTVCDTEEASSIIETLTSEGMIISANITASTDLDNTFNEYIKDDTEVTISLTVNEGRLGDVMRKIRHIHDQSAKPIKMDSEHPSARDFKEWSATKFFPDKY